MPTSTVEEITTSGTTAPRRALACPENRLREVMDAALPFTCRRPAASLLRCRDGASDGDRHPWPWAGEPMPVTRPPSDDVAVSPTNKRACGPFFMVMKPGLGLLQHTMQTGLPPKKAAQI